MTETLYRLITQTSTRLPADIQKAVKAIRPRSPLLEVMEKTIILSAESELPLCQDTGFPYFLIELPMDKAPYIPQIREGVCRALEQATRDGFLRPNSVDPVSGSNYGNNLGPGLPAIDWEWKEPGEIMCSLLLKGGGSENAGMQYSLPFAEIGAGRDEEGIVRTVLHHLQLIQGQGCSPGILGIGIGGDRVLSMKLAKKQLFRPLDDSADDPQLKKLEDLILTQANRLGIGPMGLGGSPTLLGVKVAKAARHPASFFVSLSYLCWVARRNTCPLPIN